MVYIYNDKIRALPTNRAALMNHPRWVHPRLHWEASKISTSSATTRLPGRIFGQASRDLRLMVSLGKKNTVWYKLVWLIIR